MAMILADTHVLAWLASGDKAIPPEARDELFDRGFVVSAVTAWEYGDLHSRRRLPGKASLAAILKEFAASVIDFPSDAWKVCDKLPPIHRDPVDRMLIGHALAIDATLATADAKMRRYPVKLLW